MSFLLFAGVVRMMNIIVFTSYFQECFAHVAEYKLGLLSYIYVGFTKCVSDFYLMLYSSALLYDDN